MIEFDSAAEARRWHELVQMQQRGEVIDVRRQVPFTLVEGRYTDSGRAIRYVADFVYYRPPPAPHLPPVMVVEDVKGGVITPLARLKIALLRKLLEGAAEVIIT